MRLYRCRSTTRYNSYNYSHLSWYFDIVPPQILYLNGVLRPNRGGRAPLFGSLKWYALEAESAAIYWSLRVIFTCSLRYLACLLAHSAPTLPISLASVPVLCASVRRPGALRLTSFLVARASCACAPPDLDGFGFPTFSILSWTACPGVFILPFYASANRPLFGITLCFACPHSLSHCAVLVLIMCSALYLF